MFHKNWYLTLTLTITSKPPFRCLPITIALTTGSLNGAAEGVGDGDGDGSLNGAAEGVIGDIEAPPCPKGDTNASKRQRIEGGGRDSIKKDECVVP